MDIGALDLSGGPKSPGKRSGTSDAVASTKKQARTKVLNEKIKDLRECDYVDPPRYQGLRDTPSRVFKTPPERLGPREVTSDTKYQISQ